MYERILVPLDGSALSETILPFVERIAGPLDSEVILLTVVNLNLGASVATAPAGIIPPEDLLVRKMKTLAGLSPIKERLEAKGLRVRTLVTVGDPAEEIRRVALLEGADLIAMSTHGRGGLERLMFGSVAEQVIRRAGIPVLMIRMTAVPAALP